MFYIISDICMIILYVNRDKICIKIVKNKKIYNICLSLFYFTFFSSKIKVACTEYSDKTLGLLMGEVVV